jgi:hypothetical protein
MIPQDCCKSSHNQSSLSSGQYHRLALSPGANLLADLAGLVISLSSYQLTGGSTLKYNTIYGFLEKVGRLSRS